MFKSNRQGKEWHDLRSKTQKHLLKPKAVQAYLDPMQDVARDFINKILQTRNDKKEVPDFLEELYKWALECKYYFFKYLVKLLYFQKTHLYVYEKYKLDYKVELRLSAKPIQLEVNKY